MKFGRIMRRKTTEIAELLKFTFDQNQHCRQQPILCEIPIPVSIPLAFEPPAFGNGARYLKSETTLLSIDSRPMKLSPRTSENRPHSLKLDGENVLNRQ